MEGRRCRPKRILLHKGPGQDAKSGQYGSRQVGHQDRGQSRPEQDGLQDSDKGQRDGQGSGQDEFLLQKGPGQDGVQDMGGWDLPQIARRRVACAVAEIAQDAR